MALGTPNTVMLKGDQGKREEAFASVATIKPGHWVIKDSNGKYKKNDLSTGADTELAVAVEDSYQGKTLSDAYANNDLVFAYKPLPGDWIYSRVPAGAAAIVIGDRVQLDATGCVIKLASGKPVGVAEEALDNSGGGSEVFLRISMI